jgi:hypothetical protein
LSVIWQQKLPLNPIFLMYIDRVPSLYMNLVVQVVLKEIMLENGVKAFAKDHDLDVMVESRSTQGSGHDLERSSSTSSSRHRGQQLARRTWWRKVKLVLVVDIVFCIILFVIWLVICKGFHCVR